MSNESAPADVKTGDPLLAAFFNEIGIISQLSGTMLDRALPDGMTRSQFTVLNHFVRLGGPRSLVELARSFQVTKGAMTNTTTKLRAKGLISISPDPKDGRGKLVDITEAGRAKREQCIAELSTTFASMREAFPPQVIGPLMEPMTRIRKWLDEHRDLKPGELPD